MLIETREFANLVSAMDMGGAYHSLVGERLDLLDGLRSSLFEACAKNLEI